MDSRACEILIVGAGPSGLAAALTCLARGFQDIVVLEQRPDLDVFERGRAFNYQLDGRGQRILEELGISHEQLRRHGLPNDSFRQVTFSPDGSSKSFTFPALLPGRKTPYWMTRAHLLALLRDELNARNAEGRVALLTGHSVAAIKRDDGRLEVVADTPGAQPLQLTPRLLLACDGINSAVRQGLDSLCDGADEGNDFAVTVLDSPSAELNYRVLSFPPRIPVRGSAAAADDHRLAYCFLSTFKRPGERMALFALPVPHADEARNINIILHRDHAFWKLGSAGEILAYLEAGFPQLDFAALLDSEELASFASLPAAGFPRPQYVHQLHLEAGSPDQPQDVLLIGDAAHAFPPDLGMGVNSALEEVFLLMRALDDSGDIRAACRNLAARRLPESKALVRLVSWVHPYQYNQVPWRLKLWFLGFMAHRALTRLTRGAVPPPPFVLTQKHRMDFVSMEKAALRGIQRFRFALLSLAAIIVGLVVWAL